LQLYITREFNHVDAPEMFNMPEVDIAVEGIDIV
jgi:hypothetical protein